MGFANYLKGVPNACAILGIETSPMDYTSLPIHLVVLEFVILQCYILLIVELLFLLSIIFSWWFAIQLVQVVLNCIAFLPSKDALVLAILQILDIFMNHGFWPGLSTSSIRRGGGGHEIGSTW